MGTNLSVSALGAEPPNESWRDVFIDVPLSSRPVLVASGIGVHGLHGAEQYRLPDLWCLHLYRYDARLILGGTHELPIRPGYVSILAPDMRLDYRYQGRSTHLYAHFRFETAMSGKTDSAIAMPVMQDLSDDFGRLYEYLEPIVKPSGGPGARSDARLWDALWQLADRGIVASPRGDEAPAAVRSAARIIELRLDQALRVGDIASEAGVSLGYLSQLFQTAFGTTVVGYIRRRRMERAHHLLTQSTLPVKSIAAMAGIPDLQQFNKLVHRELGASPRTIRTTARSRSSAHQSAS